MNNITLFKDKYMIREQNTKIVLEQIILHKEISRASISTITGLNKATVSEIAKNLLSDQLVIETGVGESGSSGGRKPIMLEFNKVAGVSISVDVRYNSVQAILTYLNGEVIEAYEKQLLVNKENAFEEIQQVVDYFTPLLPEVHYGIVGMTIAVHGIIDNNQIVFTPYYDLDLEETNFYTLLTKRYPFPIYLENEANLTAVAESAFSTDIQNLVSISVYKGIGAGIILNGHLYHGYKGQAGEIGHTILFPGGRPCPCGNRGCLEQYCSEEALIEEYESKKGVENITAEDFICAYLEGDSTAKQLMEKFCQNIAIGLNDIISVYAPEIMYINSVFLSDIDELLPLIKENLKSSFSHNTKVEASLLGRKACLLGGAATTIRNFLNVENLSLR